MGDTTFARGGASTGSFGSGEEMPKHLGLATGRVKRITMFKIPDLGNQQKLVDAYKVLEKRGNKDGRSYILFLDAGIIEDPARSKGYTVIGTTEFNSLDDMRFYDEECEDHAALKARARELGLEEPPLVAWCFVRVDPSEEVAL